MSSLDKIVKLACKPKAVPPKPKYIDPIIAATWSDDGTVHDVCKALTSLIRDTNFIVVYKALIVLHTMVRTGATDNVLSCYSSSEVPRLRNVSTRNWEGYTAPPIMQKYALYLESRIRAYKDLKHDVVSVHAGFNDRNANTTATSKTIMGRRLRSVTVEKGLLREMKAVHAMIDALIECRFRLDDLQDVLTVAALRMLVKDLLILFHAGNEGIINVLEHYFEMSEIDAAEALEIYRHFCKQVAHVVEYLRAAKKRPTLLDVSISNLSHPPVSLTSALQEYLDHPNFEHNRIVYKANNLAADHITDWAANDIRANSASLSSTPRSDRQPSYPTISSFLSNYCVPDHAATTSTAAKKDGKDVPAFFSDIGKEQLMLYPNTNNLSMTYDQHQGTANPFAKMATTTGQSTIQEPRLGSQPNDIVMPQQSAKPQKSNPFGNSSIPALLQTVNYPFSSTSDSATLQLSKSQVTETKNPFKPINAPPPGPNPPNLFELFMGSSDSDQAQKPGKPDISSLAYFSLLDPSASHTHSTPANGILPQDNLTTNTTAAGSTFGTSLFSSVSYSRRSASNNPFFSPSEAQIKSNSASDIGMNIFKPSPPFDVSTMETSHSIFGSEPSRRVITGLPSPSGIEKLPTTGFLRNPFSSNETPNAPSCSQNDTALNIYIPFGIQPLVASGSFSGTGGSSTFGSSLGGGLRPGDEWFDEIGISIMDIKGKRPWRRTSELEPITRLQFESAREPTVERATILDNEIATFQCNICFDEMRVDHMVQLASCAHTFCRYCLREHVTSTIDQHRYPILCAVCTANSAAKPTILDDIFLVIGLTEAEFELAQLLQLAAHAIVLHCRKCQETMFVDRSDHRAREFITCPLRGCNYSWCKNCEQPIDFEGPKHSCDGSSELKTLMEQRGWRKCPGCQTPIQKETGCNHMACTAPGCNTHFCYRCGEMITQSLVPREIRAATSAHYKGCQLFEVTDTNT